MAPRLSVAPHAPLHLGWDLSELKVERSGFDYVATWDDLNLRMVFHSLHEGKGEGVYAEVEIQAAEPRSVLYWGMVNVTSDRSREMAARRVVAEYQRAGHAVVDMNIEHLINQAAYKAVKLLRAGNPILSLSELAPRGRRRYHIDTVLPARVPTSLFADGGTGKGIVAVDMAVCIAAGHNWHGFEVTQGNVLYLDWETDELELQDRISRICAGYGWPVPRNLYYRHCLYSIRNELPAILRFIQEKQISVIIVDSLGLAIGGDINGPNEVIDAFSHLRLTGCTVLAIDHVSKGSAEESSGKAIGSVYKHNLVRSSWELIKDDTVNGEQGDMTVGLFHRKNNLGGRRTKPIVLKVHFDGDDGPISIENAMLEASGLAVHGSLSDRILAELKGKKLTKTNLVDNLGAPATSVSTVLARLRSAGMIDNTGGKVPEWFIVYRP